MLPTDNFPSFADNFEGQEIEINNQKFLKLLNKTRILFQMMIQDIFKWYIYTPNRGTW